MRSRRFTLIPAVALATVVLFCLLQVHAVAAEPKGRALAIGLNKLNPAHYAGSDGELFACESDARDMAAIATSKGFQVTTLLTARATREAVLSELKSAAAALASGDIFVLSYSGHGGEVFDENGDEKSNGPDDVLDETWCLFDGQMIDDELYAAFRKFKPGVRILAFSDSCHSGTVAKVAFYDQIIRTDERSPFIRGASLPQGFARGINPAFDLGRFFIDYDRNPNQGVAARPLPASPPPFRALPMPVAMRTWAMHRVEYKAIGTNPEFSSPAIVERGDEGDVQACGLLISGCQDNQLSKDGWLNGAFTGVLKQVWSSAAPGEVKNYRTFHAAIVKKFENDPSQTPNYYPFGKSSPDFEAQSPFTIK